MTERVQPKPGPVAADPYLGKPPDGEPGAPPLLLPHLPFPPYRFVPGLNPHPFVHSNGYLHGRPRTVPPPITSENWREHECYLRGIDFFNRGWWWEAHEAWEDLWHVMQRHDAAWAELLKALIQLAACALNRERGSDAGAERLLESACAGLGRVELVERGLGDECGTLGGVHVARLAEEARRRLGTGVATIVGFHVRPSYRPR